MKKVAIYYGSTTGTTEDIVKRVAERLDSDLYQVIVKRLVSRSKKPVKMAQEKQ